MRSGVLALKSRVVSLTAGVFLALAAASIQPMVSTHEAAAEPRSSSILDEIGVGTELLATEDVQLSRAGISKGSKISITKLLLRQGEVASVDVLLADGHVVKKVAIGTIRTFFRVLNSR
jgi:hypothetical protein